MTYAPRSTRVATPVGTVEIEAEGATLSGIRIVPTMAADAAPPADPLLAMASAQLAEYFAGKRRDFDLPLQPARSDRGTALRLGIAAIGYGETASYGALAKALDSGPRAVGQACRRNPFPIVIPCHRVTSASGPEHYSGGDGVATKSWLLAFERRQLVAGAD